MLPLTLGSPYLEAGEYGRAALCLLYFTFHFAYYIKVSAYEAKHLSKECVRLKKPDESVLRFL